MAQQIDRNVIRQTAVLAQLELTDGEEQQAMEDMQKILDGIGRLDELDTSREEPLFHLSQNGNVFRDDQVKNGNCREKMLANAPKQKNGQYQVPQTINQD